MSRHITDEEITAREQELRNCYPHSFSHPELKEGEMCTGPYIPDDFPQRYVKQFQDKGLHARLTSYELPKDNNVEQCFLVVNIREQILSTLHSEE